MEVHHHPIDIGSHTARKKWTHYFWEFLMLFLAVFAGFLAEYKLEHVIEHDREKQYIVSLIEDLKDNDRQISDGLMVQEKRIAMMDSMIDMLNYPVKIKGNEGLLYYLARISPRSQPLSLNTRTFEQLKNSGNFRLIRKIETSNKIMSYYENIPLLRLVEELYQKEFEQYKILASRIFDPTVFSKMENKAGAIVRTNENVSLQSYDINLIKQLAVFAVYMNGSARGVIQQATKIKSEGKLMMDYLQNEYHLK
jgi:hypothetical protein